MKAPIKIREWAKTDSEVIRVELSTYKGESRINARVWYTDSKTGELEAGKNGLNLPIEHLRKLSKALTRAVKEAEKTGLIEKEGDE